jgi:hypothetical protein
VAVVARCSIRWLAWCLAVIICSLGSAAGARAAGKVKVTVVTILATTRNDGVDKRLRWIAEEIQKKEKDLKGFHIGPMQCRSLAPGEKYAFELPDKQEVVVVINHGADKENRVELKVKAPLQGEIVYDTVCGKFLPIVTRYKTKARDERLIIAIMVRPCHKK